MKSSKRPVESSPAAAAAPAWPLPLALLVAAFLLYQIYSPALDGPFLFDDVYLPFLVPNFAQNSLLKWMAGVRPTLQLSYWLNYQLGGLSPYPYHLTNLLLHAASAFCVWSIARKLIGAALPSRPHTTAYAALTTAVFLLHPLQTESVSYIASRSEVLSAFFFLAAWAIFLHRREPAIRLPEVLLVLLFFALAITSKEHAAVLPAVLLLTDYFFNPGFSLDGIKRNWRLYAPLFAGALLGAAAIFQLVLSRSTSAGFGMRDLSPSAYLFTQFRSLLSYLRLFLFPAGLNVDHDVPISHSLTDHLSWLCLLVLLALSAAAWLFRRRAPLAAFGFLTFLLLLAPTSTFVPIRDVLVERRMYMAVFALSLCLVDLLRSRSLPVPSIAGLTVALAFLLSFLTWQRNHVWAGPIPLWQDTAANSPAKFRPRFQLAYAFYQAGQCADALPHYAEAARLSPEPSFDLFVDWALAADCANRPSDALARLNDALRVENSAHAWSLLGMVHAKQGDFDKALSALDNAQRQNPSFPMTYAYRGNVHLARREWLLAIPQFEQALKLEPANPVASQGLTRARAEARKQ
jgi:tetratricopeptide (TPR) repeat protein